MSPRASRRFGRSNNVQRCRGEGIEGTTVEIDIVAEDPVQEVLQGQCGGADEETNKKSGLKSLLLKHKDTIKRDTIVKKMKDGEPKPEATALPAGGNDGSVSPSGQSAGPTSPNTPKARADKLWNLCLETVTKEGRPGEGSPTGRPQPNLSQDRKEACQMLRFFVFGQVGNESAKNHKEKEQVYLESMGSREKVRMLHNLWMHLDEDGSGRVDIHEFREYALKNMMDKFKEASPNVLAALPAWAQVRSGTPEEGARFIHKFCEKLTQLLLGKKSSFVIEDMMKLVWPSARVFDVKAMRKMCNEFMSATCRKRVKTPPVLPASEVDGLESVFRFFDEDRSGSVMLEELISKGLIYSDQAAQYIAEWDKNGDGCLDLKEFCDMMCPCGYRASKESVLGSQFDGRRVIFDKSMDCWRLEDDCEEVEE